MCCEPQTGTPGLASGDFKVKNVADIFMKCFWQPFFLVGGRGVTGGERFKFDRGPATRARDTELTLRYYLRSCVARLPSLPRYNAKRDEVNIE